MIELNTLVDGGLLCQVLIISFGGFLDNYNLPSPYNWASEFINIPITFVTTLWFHLVACFGLFLMVISGVAHPYVDCTIKGKTIFLREKIERLVNLSFLIIFLVISFFVILQINFWSFPMADLEKLIRSDSAYIYYSIMVTALVSTISVYLFSIHVLEKKLKSKELNKIREKIAKSVEENDSQTLSTLIIYEEYILKSSTSIIKVVPKVLLTGLVGAIPFILKYF